MASLRELLPAATDGHTAPTPPSSPPPTRVVVRPAAPSPRAGVSKVLALPSDANNASELDYAAVVRQGENASRTVHASHDALVEKPLSDVAAEAPTREEEADVAAQTAAALQRAVALKTGALRRPTASKPASASDATYVRYTPANRTAQPDGGARDTRIIKLVTRQRDPMEPPRHRHVKAPANPPSPPVPVLHSPERRATKEEQREWNIPPVVSDWKNNRGYTISLDKRLAADARAAQDHSVSDRFASMADALFQAERDARRDVELRARLQRQVSVRAKAARERELRDLADRARRERQGFVHPTESHDPPPPPVPVPDDPPPPPSSAAAQPVPDEAPPTYDAHREDGSPRAPRSPTPPPRPPPRVRRSRFSSAPVAAPEAGPARAEPATEEEEAGDAAARARRDVIRRVRREERERELRQADEAARGGKRGRYARDAERDVAERAALGQAVATSGDARRTGELLYDERLFSHDGPAAGSRGGRSLAGGFGADDAYSLYETPLFKGADVRARSRFRGSAAAGATQASRSGAQEQRDAAERKTRAEGARRREGAVEFERDSELKSSANTDDAYGLNKLFDDAARKGGVDGDPR